MAKRLATAMKAASTLLPSKWLLADRSGSGHTAHQGEPVQQEDIRLKPNPKWEAAGKSPGDVMTTGASQVEREGQVRKCPVSAEGITQCDEDA